MNLDELIKPQENEDEKAFFEEVFLKSAAEELATSTPPCPLELPEQRSQHSLQQIHESFANWKENLNHAGKLLSEAGFKCASLENPRPRAGGFPESIKTYYDLLIATPQDFLEMTEEEYDQIYSIACDHLEMQDFKGAADLFLLLVTLNPDTSPPWLGLGLIEQQQGNFESALVNFSQAIALDPENPLPYLYIAKNLYLADHDSEAIELLEELIAFCADSPDWEEIKNSASSLKDTCSGGI